MLNHKNFKTNSLEHAFLICCSRIVMDNEAKENLKTLAVSGLDWSFVVDKAERQGVAQFLYHHLSGLNEIWSVIPQELRDRLKQYYYSILTRNWLMQTGLKKVISLLNEAQIPVIVLKGVSLLETVYKNIGLRPMSDVDLLVKREDLSQIKSILQEVGYRKPDNLGQDSLEKFGGEVHLWNEEGLFLDIHTNLSQYERFQNVFRIDRDADIWAKSRIYQTDKGQIRILNPIHLIIHLCLHQAMAHGFVGLFRFCDLRETILTYQSEIDWSDLIAKAQRYKMKKIIYYSLFLTQELFGPLVADDILENLKPNKKQSILLGFFISKKKILSLPDLEPTLRKYLAQLFLMDGVLDAVRVFVKIIFPSREWLLYNYGQDRKKGGFKYPYRLQHIFSTIFNLRQGVKQIIKQ